MREIILDTETTGLDFSEDRVIEIGAVEIEDLIPTGRTFHTYVNPQGRKVHPGAFKVHGISNESLKGKPTFKRVCNRFLKFIGDAPLVAHNASFDVAMLNAELRRLGEFELDNPVVDTLVLAREVKKGGLHNLDTLCKHFGITTKRDLHGALLDARILADVYMELRGGRQFGLGLVVEDKADSYVKPDYGERVFQSRLTPEEAAAHAAFVSGLKGSIWAQYLEEERQEAA